MGAASAGHPTLGALSAARPGRRLLAVRPDGESHRQREVSAEGGTDRGTNGQRRR